ncbi:hypothetical protein [Pseudoduganella violacea]|uniref:Flagellar protein FliT n=1 Tax=Pseudoduganella violacea TaxID=1715466 RepID=A0A7W5BCV5_9BURK|nr:hypothetical protein [Pseudoduganella violacea]MBB3120827.1 hypothetical protein [Pseudoduganella violacea]
MDRQHTLLQLAQKLSAASTAADWDALAAADALLAASLPALAQQGPWTAPELAALTVLRQQHGAALARCTAAGAELAARMSTMNTNKEGWYAYSLDNEVIGHEA